METEWGFYLMSKQTFEPTSYLHFLNCSKSLKENLLIFKKSKNFQEEIQKNQKEIQLSK